MSVDTCRDRWVPVRYEKPYKCPNCEMGASDTNPEMLAVVTGRLGDSVGLQCQICGFGFIMKEDRA